MPVCPSCKAEYRDGYIVCKDCGTELVSGEAEAGQYGLREKKRQPQAAARSLSDRLLANVSDAVELAYIKSALAAFDIPCRVIAEDVSQYLYILHGRSFMGVNVYVPESDYAAALEALASYRSKPLPGEAGTSAAPGTGGGYRFGVWLLVAFVGLSLISLIIAGVFFTGF